MRHRLCGIVLLMQAVSAGCGLSGHEDVDPLTADSIQAPDSWTFSGTTWTRTLTPADDDWKVLKVFFEQHPGYADSADLAGEPLVYRATGSDRLFIWTQAAVGGSRWQLIRKQGGRFFQDFGTDVPWSRD
ncbi:MAG: hypothetical protein ACKO2L_21000 [Planctomycetaceae bacterium]